MSRVKGENVSKPILRAKIYIRGLKHTIENGVGNKTTRIDCFVANGSQRLAISLVQSALTDKLALELIRVQALDVSSMVLVEVCELVVEKDGRVEFYWDVKLEITLLLLCKIDTGIRGAVEECKLRRVVFGVVLTSFERVREAGEVCE